MPGIRTTGNREVMSRNAQVVQTLYQALVPTTMTRYALCQQDIDFPDFTNIQEGFLAIMDNTRFECESVQVGDRAKIQIVLTKSETSAHG